MGEEEAQLQGGQTPVSTRFYSYHSAAGLFFPHYWGTEGAAESDIHHLWLPQNWGLGGRFYSPSASGCALSYTAFNRSGVTCV